MPLGANRIAIMQPYFYPYGGYFRLMAACDIFVIFDDVQFPRRGRVHRCQMPAANGRSRWLTLPLARQPRDILIRNLAFAAEARQTLDKRLDSFPSLARASTPLAGRLRDHLRGPLAGACDFLEQGVRLVGDSLRLPARIVRSSSLTIDPGLRGQDRIIALTRALGGATYVNAPGGRALYDAAAFERAGIDLRFLTPYSGRIKHMLIALAEGDPADLRRDILETTSFAP